MPWTLWTGVPTMEEIWGSLLTPEDPQEAEVEDTAEMIAADMVVGAAGDYIQTFKKRKK